MVGALSSRTWLKVAAARLESPRRRERAFAEALRILAASTRSGHSLPKASLEVGGRVEGRVGAAFSSLAARLQLGVSTEAALAGLSRDLELSSARLFAKVVGLQHRRGGDLAFLCQRVARLLHERGRLDQEARAATAQARFTARAVVLVPAIAVVGWAWLAPDSLQAMLTPAMLLVASPAILLILVGILVVRRLARGSLVQDRALVDAHPANGRIGLRLDRLAGAGTLDSRSRRLGLAVGCPALMFVSWSGFAPLVTWCALVALACAVAWPYLHDRRQRQHLEDVADSGLPTLLELSLALLAAGATPREVVLGAISGCPEPLAEHLRPAAAQLRLGRSVESALAALEVVQGSPELDAWAHAITTGGRFGTPVSETLQTLLRDARSQERERFRARAATMGPRIQLATVLLIVPGVMWLMLAATANGLLRELQHVGMLATG